MPEFETLKSRNPIEALILKWVGLKYGSARRKYVLGSIEGLLKFSLAINYRDTDVIQCASRHFHPRRYRIVLSSLQSRTVDRSIGAAIASIHPITASYQKTGDRVQLERMLTEQAQAYSSLGQQRKAISILCGGQEPDCIKESALAIARQQSDPLGESAGLGSLGNAYRLQGDYDKALRSLSKSLSIAEKLQNSAYSIVAKNGLGNTYASLAK